MSKTKRRKIDALQKLFEQREQAATSHFVNALQRLRREQDKNVDMQGFLVEYRNRYLSGTGAGMTAGFIKGWQRFLSSLEDATEVQRLQAEKAQRSVDASRTHVVASRMRVRAGEMLEGRMSATLAKRAYRQERHDLDDLANRRT